MAQSRAEKRRRHDIRNGRRDPGEARGKQPDYSTHERKTPTLGEKRNKRMQKYKDWRRYQ